LTMFKAIIIAVLLAMATAGIIYADNMGMGLDMGMSTGGGAGGSFPSEPTDVIAGSDGILLAGSGGTYLAGSDQ